MLFRSMFVNFGDEEESHILPILDKLRSKGISSEIYPDAARMKRQMTYANRTNAHFVAIVGGNEIADNTVTIRNMRNGDQKTVALEEAIEIILKK